MIESPFLTEIDAIDFAVLSEKPTRIFAMFSGGHDSLCSTHVTSKHPLFEGVVHINTGIGIEETRQFVRDTCAAYGWPLYEYTPPRLSYEQFVLKFGFPGPGYHTVVYRYLKERTVEEMMRQNRRYRGERIGLSTGCRLLESDRRMGNGKTVSRRGGQVWINPILYWGEDHKHEYMQQNGLPRNQVVEVMCMSGECLCGAFAKPGELAEIETWYPDAAREIRRLEALAESAGKHSKWGTRPPRPSEPIMPGFNPLCTSCEQKHFARLEVDYGTEKKGITGNSRKVRYQESDARAQ